MPWNVSWQDPEETIVLFEPVEPFTWDEYVEAAERAQAMIREKSYIVDTIYSLNVQIKLPGPSSLHYLREVYINDPKNSGMIAVIGAAHMIKTFVGIITSSLGGVARFAYVSSMDEALERIKQNRARRDGHG